MDGKANDLLSTGISTRVTTKNNLNDMFDRNCVLYFPFNRYEEPAWLNEANLRAKAQYMPARHLTGQTNRKIISYSPLHDNQNWLFDVIYDRAAFEIQTSNFRLPLGDGNTAFPLPIFSGYSGQATNTYEVALQIAQAVTRRMDVRFGIGPRSNRVVTIESTGGQLVPNVFQLSSGETSLLNLFLSILRDFDLCGASFSQAADIHGIVIVDEIDLHLHAVHQNEVLPELVRMFPNVQFVVTTHSPLFVLGMQRVFGEDGFALYRLPQGHRINPEEFSEFGDAYRSFAATRTFAADVQKAIEENQQPILLPEGETDIMYLERASQVLGRQHVLGAFQMRDGGGAGKLTNIYREFHPPLTDFLQNPVVLLFDCDMKKPNAQKGKVYMRTAPFKEDDPIKEGIENLFTRETLERAKQYNSTFINIEDEHEAQIDGQKQTVPERWTVNKKKELCDWLCNNGTEDDFQAFNEIFDLLDEILKSGSVSHSAEIPE